MCVRQKGLWLAFMAAIDIIVHMILGEKIIFKVTKETSRYISASKSKLGEAVPSGTALAPFILVIIKK